MVIDQSGVVRQQHLFVNNGNVTTGWPSPGKSPMAINNAIPVKCSGSFQQSTSSQVNTNQTHNGTSGKL